MGTEASVHGRSGCLRLGSRLFGSLLRSRAPGLENCGSTKNVCISQFRVVFGDLEGRFLMENLVDLSNWFC